MMTKKEIAKYTLLPGILPRLLEFFRSGFAHIAYLLAVIYSGVRLIPPHHPYLNPQNFGRFGMRHVIAEAANNLVLDRRNIDQIIVFFVLLMGIFLLFAQFAILIFSLTLGHPALAGSALDSAVMLGTPALGTSQDMAAILLDRVFGLRGNTANVSFFGSCIGTAAADCTDLNGNVVDAGGTYPWPFHQALHRLLSVYSNGIFAIGVFILLYYITAIVAETAANGTPFGQRMNKTWVPIRIILFLFLLMPIQNGTYANGLNFGQLFLMKVVELGSNFATNGWVYFNFQATSGMASNSYLTQQQQMIADPNLDIKEAKDFVHFFSMARTCKEAYHRAYGRTFYPESQGTFKIDAYLIRSPIDAGSYGAVPGGIDGNRPNALLLSALNAIPLQGFNQAAAFNVYGDITVRFGYLAPMIAGSLDSRFSAYRGNVMPLCGDMTLKVTSLGEDGARLIQSEYLRIIRDAWVDPTFEPHTECTIAKSVFKIKGVQTNCADDFHDSFIEDRLRHYHTEFRDAIDAGIADQKTNGLFDIPQNILERGWAGAALWYNKIAEMNGAVTTASFNIPEFTKLPSTLERIQEANRQQNSNVPPGQEFADMMYDMTLRNVKLQWPDDKKEKIANALRAVNDVWVRTSVGDGGGYSATTGNVMIDFINLVFGTSGIFDMRKNADVHPLAQLSGLGKSMIEATVRNAGTALVFRTSSLAWRTAAGNSGGTALDTFSDVFFSLVATTIGMGVILFYILPMMPFLYFFFATSGWLKSIFEAMVAMPLWALAHLKIDGEGVMGPSAFNGYALLLEIFLRPILILAGLLASITIFSALVGVLNIVFDQIVSNVGGFDTQTENQIISGNGPPGLSSMMQNASGGIDEFFYTAMYVIICYMMALSCFKLVDQVPNQILRWAGLSVTTYNEGAKDPVGQLASTAQRSSILVVNQLKGRASTALEMGA